MNDAILEIEHLTKRFGGVLAVNDVSVSVTTGEVLGIIGPNGAGKTTLFNCIAGFYAPDAGRITFAGEDITGLVSHKVAEKGIARTFQIPRVLPRLSVLENVLPAALMRHPKIDDARETAHRWLNFVGLSGKESQPAHSLNVASKRMLELARALATDPKLLLIDEAAAGLTDTEISSFNAKITEINHRGITIIIIDHVMKAIVPVVSRLVVLDSGKKIAEGLPSDVLHNQRVREAYLGVKSSS